MKLLKLIQLIRPKEWVKNFFCFAPIIFSGQLFNLTLLFDNILAFCAFCGISGCTYIMNDITDVESDRAHKKKRFRPIASGDVSIPQAWGFFAVIIILTLSAAYYVDPLFLAVVLIYFVINILYTYKVKNVVILDVFFISFGFILRVIGGAVAIDVAPSSWLIITTIFISLFLGISKRRAELAGLNNVDPGKRRKVLDEYTLPFADQITTIAVTGTIISYALYTVNPTTVSAYHSDKLIYTTPFVIYGLFRYLFLIHKQNAGENPASIVTKDLPIIIDCLLWFLASAAIIYRHKLGF